MSHALQLGSAVVTHSKASLQLSLTSSVLLASSGEKADTLSAYNPLILNDLKEVWICRGQGLHLDLQVDSGNLQLSGAQKGELRDILQNAELWSQLGLLPSQPPQDEAAVFTTSNSLRLRLNLQQRRDSHAQPRLNLYRLCYNVSAADLKPPVTVDLWHMTQVRLHATISDCRKVVTKRKRATSEAGYRDEHRSGLRQARPQEQPDVLAEEKEDALLLELPRLDSGYDFVNCSQSSEADCFRLSDCRGWKKEEDDLLLEDSVHLDQSTFVVGPDTLMPKSSIPVCPAPSYCQQYTPQEKDRQDGEYVTSLIDAALRLTIHEKPLRLQRGIRCTESTFQTRLSELAPALWSPGHAKALSTRAPLIPTIARSISVSLYRNTRSESLRSKIDQLVESHSRQQPLSAECQAESVHNRDEVRRFEAVSAAIWKHTEDRLFNKSAARKLKPLASRVKVGEPPGIDEDLFASVDETYLPPVQPYNVVDEMLIGKYDEDEDLFDLPECCLVNEQVDLIDGAEELLFEVEEHEISEDDGLHAFDSRWAQAPRNRKDEDDSDRLLFGAPTPNGESWSDEILDLL